MIRALITLGALVLVSLCSGCGSAAENNGSARPADLWRFAALGNAEGVRQLVDQGIDLDALHPFYAMTALEMASCYGQPAVVDLLIKGGADVNARNGEQGTPILAAAFFGRTQCLQLLLENGGDPILVNEDGVTPMFATYADGALTQEIADLLQMQIDLDSVEQGREAVRQILGPYFPGFVHPLPSN